MMPNLCTQFICVFTVLAVSGCSKNDDKVVPKEAVPAIASAESSNTVIYEEPVVILEDIDLQAGKTIVDSQCAGCHGADGIATVPAFPNLAGQHLNYLILTMHQFKEGQRTNPIMSAQMAALNDADIQNVAAFYASLPIKPLN